MNHVGLVTRRGPAQADEKGLQVICSPLLELLKKCPA